MLPLAGSDFPNVLYALVSQTWIITVPISRVVLWIKWVNTYKEPKAVHGTS